MHKPTPFYRAMQMMQAIVALMRTHNGTAPASLVDELGSYESRGHGRNTYSSTRMAAASARKHQQRMATAARHRNKMKAKGSRRSRT